MNKLIILGSSRNDGETKAVADRLIQLSGWDLIDLNDHDFSYYDYEHGNAGDDFIPLMKKIVSRYDVLVFATPVYWYAMSGIMKVFFDRFTDLLEIEKPTGRKLRGKKTAALSSSYGNNLGDAFWLPFRETARYLGMEYLGNVHIVVENEKISQTNIEKIRRFVALVNEAET